MNQLSCLLLSFGFLVTLSQQQSISKGGGVNIDSSKFRRPEKAAPRDYLSYTLPTLRTLKPFPLKKTGLDSDFSKQDPCKLNRPCKNRGQCVNTVNGFYCACPSTHYGKLCEYVLDDKHCVGHKCVNNATCYSVDTERRVVHGEIDGAFLVRYECFCLPGFIGAFCEFSENERICEQDHCLHHGVAFRSKRVELGVNCICVCEPFYYGERCQYVSLCKDFVCHNEGVCEEIVLANGERSAHCICPQKVRLFDDGVSISGVHCEHVRFSASLSVEQRKCLPCTNEATVRSYQECLKYLIPAPSAEVFNGFNKLSDTLFCSVGATCVPTVSNASDVEGNIASYLFASCNCTNPLTYGLFCEHKRVGLCEMTSDEKAVFGRDNRCLNGAHCIVDASINTWRCDCSSGYTGQTCEVKDPCRPDPCKNGAQCVRIPETVSQQLEFEHTCLCKMDQDVDADSLDCIDAHYGPCASHPCAHGGACFPCDLYGDKDLLCDQTEQKRGFHCVCKPGSDGLLCDNRWNPCSIRPCLFGGRCIPLDRFEYRCECLQGYNGSICENMFDLCLVKGFPCMKGKCSVDDNFARGYRCDCYDGFGGLDCELEINTASLSAFLTHWGFIVWPSVMFVVVFPVMALGVFWRERRSRKELLLFGDQHSSTSDTTAFSQATAQLPTTLPSEPTAVPA